MRVLVVHNRYRSTQPSGENSVVDDEVHFLRARGCVVERAELESDEIASWPAAKRAVLPARVVWSAGGSRIVGAAVTRHRPDVVHVHNTFPLFSPAALRSASRTGAAVVQTLHNFRPLCAAATFLRDGRTCTECLGGSPLPAVRHGCYRDSRAASLPVAAMIGVHRALGTWERSVDRYVLPSEFARQLYVEAGWPEELLALKPNTALVEQAPRTGPGGPFVCLSRLTREKGVETLLEGWREAFPDGGQRLVVVGSGDEEERVRRLAAGIRGVELRGSLPQSEALALLAGARALVVPSICFEVFPRTVVEAYALGVPVIASRLGSLAQVVEDGVTGLHAAAGSAPELAAALRRLAESPLLSERLGRAARAVYERELRPDVTTERLLEIYDAAITARRARAAAPAAAALPLELGR